MAIETIGEMSLLNEGGFVCQLAFTYYDDDGNRKISAKTGDITLGCSKTADPGDLGVPDGTMIWAYAFVVWGQDNTASPAFRYQKGNTKGAHYTISGTTLKNSLALTGVDGDGAWSNWAGSLTAVPSETCRPGSVGDVQQVVARDGGSIRAVGTGHSWSPLVVTSDVLVDMTNVTDGGRKAWRWQRGDLNLVTFLPAARWADVRDALVDSTNPAPRMYLPTAGVLPSINATGFVAAGCHGTGWRQPTVSDLIYAIEIVAADGQVHCFSEDTTPELMPAVRVSLGTLGLITKVTLKVEPMFRLWDQERAVATADVMGPNPAANGGRVDASKLAALVTGNDYVELFWFPWSGGLDLGNDGSIWVKQYNRTTEPVRDVPQLTPDWQAYFAQTLMEQVAEHPTSVVLVPPAGVVVWEQLRSAIAGVERTNGFVAEAPRVLHYQEQAFPVIDLEIAIPIPATGPNAWDFTNVAAAWYQAVDYVRQAAAQPAYPLTCCLHARFTGNSQSLLSPAYQPTGSETHTCWIEVLSAYPKGDPNPANRSADVSYYEALIAAIGPTWINRLGGRPHWAKYWQSIPGIDVRSLYPRDNLDEFNALRRKLDPNGRFLNHFLGTLNMFE